MSLSANSGATVVFDVPPADTGSPRNATNNDVTTSAATATRASTVRARTTGSYPVPGLSGASRVGTPDIWNMNQPTFVCATVRLPNGFGIAGSVMLVLPLNSIVML